MPQLLETHPGEFQPMGILVTIKSPWNNLLRAKFAHGSHEAFHCLKQWKEQFPDLVAIGCTFASETVYVSAQKPSTPSQGDSQ